MKTNRITLLAVLCLAFFSLCRGQNQSTPPITPTIPEEQQPRAYTLPLPLYSKSKAQTIIDNVIDSINLPKLIEETQKQQKRIKNKAIKGRNKHHKVRSSRNEKSAISYSDGGVTFVVDGDLSEIDNKYFNTLLNGNEVAKSILSDMDSPHKSQMIATSFADESLTFQGKDVFFRSIIRAYASHRPIVLSPDMIWLLISQGFSRYVNAHPELLREQLVNHTGKMDLVVQTSEDLLTGHPDWTKLLDGFRAQIEANTKGDLAQTITADFSTTGATERIASEVTLMETVKSYFEYIIMRIACGLPTVTLKGTSQDWQKVLDKTQQLKPYGLEAWTESLTPILKEFVLAAQGCPNRKFWQSMVKQTRPDQLEGGACNPNKPTEIDGWLLKLFPDENGQTLDHTPHTKSMPVDRARANFKYQQINPADGSLISQTTMELTAGFVGAEVDKVTHAVTPKIGWMICTTDDNEATHLKALQGMNKPDSMLGIHIRVKEVPEILAQIGHIHTLHLVFTDEIVLPDWMDSLTIDELIIADGDKLSDTEKETIRQRFPQVQFSAW